MTSSIPLKSNARKHTAEIQCVTRTVAGCRSADPGRTSAAAVGREPKSDKFVELAIGYNFASIVRDLLKAMVRGVAKTVKSRFDFDYAQRGSYVCVPATRNLSWS